MYWVKVSIPTSEKYISNYIEFYTNDTNSFETIFTHIEEQYTIRKRLQSIKQHAGKVLVIFLAAILDICCYSKYFLINIVATSRFTTILNYSAVVP